MSCKYAVLDVDRSAADMYLASDTDKPIVLPATRDVSDATKEGLPAGAYDPKRDEAYQEVVKSNVPEETHRKKVSTPV